MSARVVTLESDDQTITELAVDKRLTELALRLLCYHPHCGDLPWGEAPRGRINFSCTHEVLILKEGMMSKLGTSFVILSLLVGLFGWTTAEAASSSTTCTSGAIAPGTYVKLVITGNCTIPSGTVTVTKNVEIKPNASLNAATFGGTLTVGGDITVGKNAILVLGCGPGGACPTPTTDKVTGSIVASQALSVLLANNSIGGSVSISHGGGGLNCNVNTALSAVVGNQTPAYDDVTRNSIGGGVTMIDVKSCWMGVIGNAVTGNVTVRGNSFTDPDADEIVSNTIGKNLTCFGNTPAPQLGDSGGTPNTVTGSKLGQCVGL